MAYTIHSKKTWAQTMTELRNQFALWRVRDWQVEGPSGVTVNATGAGKFAAKAPADPIAARRVKLIWIPPGRDEPITFVKDAQETAADNLRVLFLVIESMRLNEVRGVSDDVREAYLALGPGGPRGEVATTPLVTPPPRDPYEVLEVRPDASKETIEASYRALTRKLGHPTSANEAAYLVLNQARDRALEALRVRAGNGS